VLESVLGSLTQARPCLATPLLPDRPAATARQGRRAACGRRNATSAPPSGVLRPEVAWRAKLVARRARLTRGACSRDAATGQTLPCLSRAALGTREAALRVTAQAARQTRRGR